MFGRSQILLAAFLSSVVHGLALSSFYMPELPPKVPEQRMTLSVMKIDEHVEEKVIPKVKPKPVVKKRVVKPKPKTLKPPVPKPAPRAEPEVLEQVQPKEIESVDTEVELIRANYQDLVVNLLSRKKRYPRIARRRGLEGEAVLKLIILPDGSVKRRKLLSSTQVPPLDSEILKMVERAAPFPPFPKGFNKDVLVLEVPIRFQLG